MRSGLIATSLGAFVAAFVAANVYGSELKESNFAGNTTNPATVIVAIATAVNPSTARGVAGW